MGELSFSYPQRIAKIDPFCRIHLLEALVISVALLYAATKARLWRMDCRGVNYLIFYGCVVAADSSLVGFNVAASVLLIGAKSPMMNARKGFRKSLIFRIDLLIL
jgi:hypothetical protein